MEYVSHKKVLEALICAKSIEMKTKEKPSYGFGMVFSKSYKENGDDVLRTRKRNPTTFEQAVEDFISSGKEGLELVHLTVKLRSFDDDSCSISLERIQSGPSHGNYKLKSNLSDPNKCPRKENFCGETCIEFYNTLITEQK